MDWVGPTERILYDLRVRSRGSVPLSGQVGILNIDDATLQKLGTWPLSRSAYAPALKNLKSKGARWLGLDIIFA